MATELEQLTAIIDANTTRWENKLTAMSSTFDKKAAAIEKRNAAMVTKMNSGWSGIGGGLNQITSRLAGVFSTAAVIGFSKSILDTGDALQDASAQLGVTAQQLQALDYAARVSGASSDKLVQALSYLSDGLGQAQTGEGDMAKAMRASGIQMGTSIQVLYDVADKVKAARTETEKMSIATTYLGTKAGKSMVSFLDQGADGLRRLQEEASKKGQVWDADTLKRLDDTKDALETFKKSLVNIAAVPTSEFLTDLAHVLELLSGGGWKQGLSSLAKLAPEIAGGVVGGIAGSAAGPVGTVAGATAGAAVATWATHALFPDAPAAPGAPGASGTGSKGGGRGNVPLSQEQKDKAARAAEKALRDSQQISEMLQRAQNDRLSGNEDYLDSLRDVVRAEDQALLRRSQDWADADKVQKEVIDETAKLDIQSTNDRRDADLRAIDERKKADIDRLTQLKANAAEIAKVEADYDAQKQSVSDSATNKIATIKVNAEADKQDVPTIGKDLKNDVHTAFRDGIKTAVEGGDIKSVFASLADNFASRLSSKLGDELFDLADNVLGSLFGSGAHSGFDSLFSLFDGGGYTGPGGVKQPAGIVHKGEVVWSQDDIRRFGGLGKVEAMRLGGGVPGYSAGGVVGVPTMTMPSVPSVSRASVVAPVNQYIDLRGAMVTPDVWDKVQKISASNSATAASMAVKHALQPHVLGPAMKQATRARFTL